jgi:hypothetical protein
MVLVLIWIRADWVLLGYISAGVIDKYDFCKMFFELFVGTALVCVVKSESFPSLLTTNATLGKRMMLIF